MINIVLADDHPFFLEGIISVFNSRYDDIHVVGVASNGEEAVDSYRKIRPDVIILDIQMPVKTGIEAAKEIREIDKDAKIMILTTFDEQYMIEELFKQNINGYILKETPLEEVILDIRLVSSGQTAMNNHIMQKLYYRSYKENSEVYPFLALPELQKMENHPQLKHLGIREKQIFKMVLQGKDNIEISDLLNLNNGTVRNYIHSIYNAINVHNRSAVIIWAIDEGLL